MRSRYSAYALGLSRYIIQTTHPDGPLWRDDRGPWRDEIDRFCHESEFVGLDVADHHQDEAAGEGLVHFHAHLRQRGQPTAIREVSVFRRHKGRWAYVGPAMERG